MLLPLHVQIGHEDALVLGGVQQRRPQRRGQREVARCPDRRQAGGRRARPHRRRAALAAAAASTVTLPSHGPPAAAGMRDTVRAVRASGRLSDQGHWC